MTLRRSVFTLALVALLAAPGALAASAGAAAASSAASSAASRAAAPAADTRPALAQARALYDGAKFQPAVDLIERSLRDGTVTGDDVIAARALRARCLVKLGRRLESKEGFKAVLRSDRGFRLDPSEVPPDEYDVFRLAAQEIDSEQLEAGRRFPASIGFTVGEGQAVNQDLADLASSAGVAAADDFKSKTELGYSVRFPLRPRLSIDVEVSWLKAETSDKLAADLNSHTIYSATAMPVMVNVVKNWFTSPTRHVNAIVGAGPVICQAILENRNSLVAGRIIPTQVVGHNQGWGGQLGLEFEQLVRPRFAIAAQVRARRMTSGTLKWLRNDFEIYESYSASLLGDRSLDFSGLDARIGLRAYIGY